MLHRSAWGKGYATEAARACLDFAFGALRWPRAAHMIHPDNAGSKAVAWRLGSSLIDVVQLPPPMDVVGPTEMWGQSAEPR
jgi:RimJ/RimL family protein N-acetyltransferase